MKTTVFFIFVILFTFLSCDNDVKMGDECKLLKKEKDEVTSIENKNLDCLGLDSDGICISYEGNKSYCTIKCGPPRGCASVVCRYDTLDKEGNVVKPGESCVDSICYAKSEVCSDTNQTGLCDAGTKCGQGVDNEGNPIWKCMTECNVGEVYMQGMCQTHDKLCTPTNLDGMCRSGELCDEGRCVPTGCDDPDYACVAPINLLGHPFKNQNICIKRSNLSVACKDQTCSNHGRCKLVEGGAECECDAGYEAKAGLTCELLEDPCTVSPLTCSGNGTCQSEGGEAVCSCNEGFEQTNDKKDCIAKE